MHLMAIREVQLHEGAAIAPSTQPRLITATGTCSRLRSSLIGVSRFSSTYTALELPPRQVVTVTFKM